MSAVTELDADAVARALGHVRAILSANTGSGGDGGIPASPERHRHIAVPLAEVTAFRVLASLPCLFSAETADEAAVDRTWATATERQALAAVRAAVTSRGAIDSTDGDDTVAADTALLRFVPAMALRVPPAAVARFVVALASESMQDAMQSVCATHADSDAARRTTTNNSTSPDALVAQAAAAAVEHQRACLRCIRAHTHVCTRAIAAAARAIAQDDATGDGSVSSRAVVNVLVGAARCAVELLSTVLRHRALGASKALQGAAIDTSPLTVRDVPPGDWRARGVAFLACELIALSATLGPRIAGAADAAFSAAAFTDMLDAVASRLDDAGAFLLTARLQWVHDVGALTQPP